MTLTVYPALDDVLFTNAFRLREVMAGNFVELAPQGSVAIGGFDLTSGIDFVEVVVDELDDAVVRPVQAAHRTQEVR